jgi:hypothetical protein
MSYGDVENVYDKNKKNYRNTIDIVLQYDQSLDREGCVLCPWVFHVFLTTTHNLDL